MDTDYMFHSLWKDVFEKQIVNSLLYLSKHK